jgi:iron uptake system component EfeO
MRKPFVAVFLFLAAFGGFLAACGDDDGADVRSECAGGSGASGASGSGAAASGAAASGGSASGGSASGGCASSGSGAASGASGSSAIDEGATTDNQLVADALVEYKAYVLEQIDATIAATTEFTDAVRAGDLEGAKELYAPSRQGWEAIEPVAGLVEEIDGAVDARVDDFEGVDDPEFTGWHRIEYILWELDTTEGAAEFADGLDANLQVLKEQVEGMDIPPAALVVGASELIEEVSTGKITGEEDRYSHTDLWDFAANVEGSEVGVELLTPALEAADPELLADIQANFEELDGQLAEYEDGEGGYLSYEELTDEDKTAMQATLGELSENLSLMAGALGLS